MKNKKNSQIKNQIKSQIKTKKIKKITKVLIDLNGNKIYQYNGEDVHSKFGAIFKKQLKEAKEGKSLKTTTKKEFYVIEPTFIDKYSKLKKSAQTIPPKDLGFIVSYTGIGKKSIIYEAGAGSGGSGIFFANIVKKVFSFDIREDHLNIAKKNAKEIGIRNISFELKDISKSFGKKEVADLVLLDLPEPWIALKSAKKALKVGGWLVVYSPNTTQISKTIEEVKNNKEMEGLIYDITKEVMVRNWKISGRICHPSSENTIGHSAFLAFFRKIRR